MAPGARLTALLLLTTMAAARPLLDGLYISPRPVAGGASNPTSRLIRQAKPQVLDSLIAGAQQTLDETAGRRNGLGAILRLLATERDMLHPDTIRMLRGPLDIAR